MIPGKKPSIRSWSATSLLLLAAPAGNVLAHPGHGAPPWHLHGWDWGHLVLALALVAAAALAIWRAK